MACEKTKVSIDNHFPEVKKMVFIGSGATKAMKDLHLRKDCDRINYEIE